jgi:predicted esterase
MDNSVHYLKVQKTARIATSGDLTSASNIWLVAHGYGQLSTYFIQKFKSLNQHDHFVIVPEGLHRYYLNGFSGKVGASWMTKEDREKDIEDYCNYLDSVYEHFILKNSDRKRINALGFSQGGATISRWAANTKYPLDNLIIWGSVIPPDMNWQQDLEKLKRLHWIYVAGSHDEFLSSEQQEEQLQILKKNGIQPDTIFYEGKHDLQEDALHLLTQKCVKKNS